MHHRGPAVVAMTERPNRRMGSRSANSEQVPQDCAFERGISAEPHSPADNANAFDFVYEFYQ
jgi:hypothetical protein